MATENTDSRTKSSSCRGERDGRLSQKIYATHLEFVRKAASRLGISDPELDDICQETFLVAFQKIDGFQNGEPSAWLYQIVANIASDRQRRQRRRTVLFALWASTNEFEEPGPDHAYIAREERALVQQVLAAMPRWKRELLELFEVEGLSTRKIADRVGCKVQTVWTRLHRARREFRKIAQKLVVGEGI